MRTSTIAHCTSAWDHQRPPTNVPGKSFCTRSPSLFFSSFFTDRGLVRLLPLLSQEFLAHSRLFVWPSFDLLTGGQFYFFFFFPPRRRRWPNFRGHVTFPPSFYFPHLFNSIEVVYGMVSRDGEMAIEYRDWDTIERVNRVIPWFLRAPFVSRLMRCWVLQIDFLFFLFCWSRMRGVQIYIYMVFCRS